MDDLLYDDTPGNNMVLHGDDIRRKDDMDLLHDDIPSQNSRGILHGGDNRHMDNTDLLHDDTDPLHGDNMDPLHDDDDDVSSSCVFSCDVYVRVLLHAQSYLSVCRTAPDPGAWSRWMSHQEPR